MEPPAQQRYSFGPFVLDPVEKVLLRNGRPVPLPPKALETLLALIERRGHVLEKTELLNRVWPDTFVEEATLAQNIFTLRKALSDSANGHEYIETIPKRGYRFIAPVKMVEQQPEVRLSSGSTFPQVRPRRRLLRIVVGILVAIASLGIYLRERHHVPAPAPGARKVMLAVLPFENLSGDPKQEYFSDGLTEELITQLGGMNPQRLAVIARTSAMHYRNSQQTVAQVGSELGVDYILEGSVRREAEHVRVSAQLIRVKDQMHLWAKSFDRNQRGILALESELSYAIADEIAVQLTPKAKDRATRIHTVNADAYEAHLKGRYFLYKRNPQATRKALEYFQQAVQYDPNFALAYAEIGDCYFAGVGPTGHDAFVQAESFAQKALAIDETISGAHSVIAYARMHEFDWPAADREFRRAIELDPAHPSGYYVEFLMSQGRFDETLAIAERMAREDPVAILAVHGLGMIYFYARRYDDALQAFRKALELDPNYYWSLLRRAQTKEQIGRVAEATAEFEKLGPKAEVFLARAHALAGNTQSARQIFSRILSDPNTTKEFTYEIALVYAGLKENDKALDWLERAYDDRSYHMIYIKIDPRLDPLRAHPRFQQLLRRVGLPP